MTSFVEAIRTSCIMFLSMTNWSSDQWGSRFVCLGFYWTRWGCVKTLSSFFLLGFSLPGPVTTCPSRGRNIVSFNEPILFPTARWTSLKQHWINLVKICLISFFLQFHIFWKISSEHQKKLPVLALNLGRLRNCHLAQSLLWLRTLP